MNGSRFWPQRSRNARQGGCFSRAPTFRFVRYSPTLPLCSLLLSCALVLASTNPWNGACQRSSFLPLFLDNNNNRHLLLFTFNTHNPRKPTRRRNHLWFLLSTCFLHFVSSHGSSTHGFCSHMHVSHVSHGLHTALSLARVSCSGTRIVQLRHTGTMLTCALNPS